MISHWNKAWPFNMINLNPLHPRMLFTKFGWHWPIGSREDFLILSMYFRYFVIIFIWTILNPLYPRMRCAKFGWNWPSGSGEEDENVKSLRQRRRRQQRQRPRRTTVKFWSEELTWAFGSVELTRGPWETSFT